LFSAARRLWSELKRRRVIKTTLAYIIGAWVVIEVASVVLPAMLAPEWSLRVVIIALTFALPLVVILAWIFDIEPSSDSLTGRGIVETEGRGAAESGAPPILESAIASIAVLPLENQSPSDEHRYLADGIATELHSALAKVHRLRVAARTSAFAFRDAQTDVGQIAAKLNVQYIVSGSVQCLNNQMRVSVSVDNAAEGMQIWSEVYDRNIADLFTVQTEIAQAVASSFGGARLREEISKVAQKPTDSLNAWSLVQRARSYVLSFTPQALDESVPLLRQAIDLDEDYAAAHAALAFVLAEQAHNGLGQDLEESRASSMKHADLSYALTATDPFVLKMCGAAWAYFGEIDKSLDVLRRAVKIAPYDFGAWGYLGWPLVATGRRSDLAEVRKIMQKMAENAPQHPGVPYWLYHQSVASSCAGDDERAVEFSTQAVELNPAFPWGLLQHANALGATGDVKRAVRAAKRSVEMSPTLTPGHFEKLIQEMSATDKVARRRVGGLYDAGILVA
jgi:TolB-like protein